MAMTRADTTWAVCGDRAPSRGPRTVLVKRQETRATLSREGQARVRSRTRQAWTTWAVCGSLGRRARNPWMRAPRVRAPPGAGGGSDAPASVVRAQALPLAGPAPVCERRRPRLCPGGATSGAATRRRVRGVPVGGSGGSGGLAIRPGPRRAGVPRRASATWRANVARRPAADSGPRPWLRHERGRGPVSGVGRWGGPSGLPASAEGARVRVAGVRDVLTPLRGWTRLTPGVAARPWGHAARLAMPVSVPTGAGDGVCVQRRAPENARDAHGVPRRRV